MQSPEHPAVPPSRGDQEPGILAAFLRCHSALRRLVGRIVGPGDIEDIVQETFIRSFQAEATQKIRHPRAFMVKTATNLALNHISRSEHRLRDQLADFDDQDVYLATASLETQLESRERFLLFCRAVSKLPVQCRRAFILRKVYGLSQKEVAEFLGIAQSTVEKHVAKGLLMCTGFMEAVDDSSRPDARAPDSANGRSKGSGR